MAFDLSQWLSKQRELLGLELHEENQQLSTKLQNLSASECQDAGLSLLSLEIDSVKTTLFGRCTLCFKHSGLSRALHKNNFKVGDEIAVYNPKYLHTPSADESRVEGVISRVSSVIIEMVCDEAPNDDLMSPPLRMDLRANEATHKKMTSALNELEASSNHLVNILISNNDRIQFEVSNFTTNAMFKPMNPELNPSQLAAVNCALNAPYVSIIHGPVRHICRANAHQFL